MCLEALRRCGCSVSEKKRVFRDDLGTVSELLRNSIVLSTERFLEFDLDVPSFRIEDQNLQFNGVLNNKILRYYVRMIPDPAS